MPTDHECLISLSLGIPVKKPEGPDPKLTVVNKKAHFDAMDTDPDFLTSPAANSTHGFGTHLTWGCSFPSKHWISPWFFALESSVHHSACAMRCVPIRRQGWGVLFCSNGVVTPLEIMVIILWLTLTLPHYILMTVQLIHFYWLCLGMELWSVLLMHWKLRVYTGPWGDLYPATYW